MGRTVWLSKESLLVRNAEIKKLVEEGVSNKEIAKKYGLRADYLCSLLRKLGINKKVALKINTERIEKQVIELIKSGNSVREVGNKLNIRYNKVFNICQRNNIIVRKHKHKSNQKKHAIHFEILRQLIDTDKTLKEIAVKFNCSREQIRIIGDCGISAGFTLHPNRIERMIPHENRKNNNE